MNTTVNNCLTTGAHLCIICPTQKEEDAPLAVTVIVGGWGSDSTKSEASGALTLTCNRLGSPVAHLLLRGHGEDADHLMQVTREQHVEDVACAIAYLRERFGGSGRTVRFVGIGSSYGGYILAACAENFDALLLRAPALYLDEEWDVPVHTIIQDPKRPEWYRQPHDAAHCLSLRRLAAFSGRLLLVVGSDDEVIPLIVSEEMHAAALAGGSWVERVVLPGALHSFTGEHHEKYIGLARGWLKKVLKGPSHR